MMYGAVSSRIGVAIYYCFLRHGVALCEVRCAVLFHFCCIYILACLEGDLAFAY
jgi:hypothetical protein